MQIGSLTLSAYADNIYKVLENYASGEYFSSLTDFLCW